jgi:uncharacterized protein with HEPN domain
MTQARIADHLAHIEQAASDALSFVEGLSETEFLASKVTQQAVVMSLVIVGEAATKIMDRHPEFIALHANVPWRSMRGMRNRIAHGYFEIDQRIVWETVVSSLPDLLQRIRAIAR